VATAVIHSAPAAMQRVVDVGNMLIVSVSAGVQQRGRARGRPLRYVRPLNEGQARVD